MPIVDQHDDLCASFRDRGPREGLELLKQAAWVERTDLLSRDFAVILVSDGVEFPKFACHDAGNTYLSQWYLLNVDHGLPNEAVKVAAANLLEAAKDLGISSLEELQKLAGDDHHPGQRRVVIPAKMAESYNKTASFEPSQLRPLGRGMQDGGGQLKEGSAFDALAAVIRQWDELDPYDRHAAAVDIVKIASEVGFQVPDHIFQYGGTELNPHFEKIARARMQFTAVEEYQADYERLSKMAAALNPDDVVEALYLMDERAGLLSRYGQRLPDPLLAVYGQVKEAEYSWVNGSDYVTESILLRYAGSTAVNGMKNTFTEDVVERFRKSPAATFKAMPLEQQRLVARLATQSRDTNNGGY